ncbi:SusC/RagA family TonB-linked outer membrane protein [Portibacter lacus]|nr:SusC/RagA family TonB-linked outer membrane protein [Portibacter lacus]
MKRGLLFLAMFVCAVVSTYAQRTISGTITDNEGIPLIGANVLIKGTTIGTISDFDGAFSFEASEDATTLVATYTGYETKEVDITGISVVNIVMAEGTLLDEIVVTGYGTTKKSDLVESISTVKGSDIVGIPIASVDNLLQGRSTGVEVTAINGKPGQNGYIRIRGLTSINGNNDPLFIVDGVPVPKSVYAAINPNDVEEFSVLKDAAATSIYGARASAGVVLVSTKTGGANNSYVEYSGQFGTMEAVDDGFTLMNASQKLNYETALGIRQPMTAEQRADFLEYGTNWEDVLLRRGQLQNHNLAFSGGTEKSSYYLSVSRFDQQGISVGSDFDRTTAKFNGSLQVNDWIKVSNSLSIGRRNDNELRDRYNAQSPFVGMYLYNDYETVYNLDDNGEIQYDDFGDPIYNFTHQGFNIVEAQRNNPESNEWTDAYGNLSIRMTPIKNFSFTSTVGYTYNSFKREYFIKPNSILDGYVGDSNAPGIKTDGGNDTDRYNWSNVATYDLNVADKHNIGFLAGTEFLRDQYETYSVSGKGFPIGLSIQSVAAEITGGSTTRTDFALFSTFGQLSYTFDNNLSVKGTVRRDGSSRFGADNRYGVFYSVGAGYDLARGLMPQNTFFDQLKLRASYGTTGNEPTGLYSAIGVLQFSSYNDQTASFQGNVSNPGLRWENQQSYSVGLDFGIFKNKLTGSFELYNKTSQGLLFPNQLSRTTGFSDTEDNIGDLTNAGYEAELYYTPIRQKDFNLEFGIRFSHNKTVIDKLNSREEIAPGNAFSSVLKEGEIAYVFKLVEFSRVDPETGDLLYFDAEGNETANPAASDAKILEGKSALPKFWGGFDINAGYKGLQLMTTFSYKGGNYIYNQRRLDLASGLDGARSQQDVEALDYWKQPGDITDIPRPDVPVEPSSSTRFLEKGDYIRLRNVRLSYSLPSKVANAMRMKDVSFFVSGSNLATFTNFKGDPEVGVFVEESASDVGGQLPGEFAGFSYPNTVSYTGGLTVRF